MVPKHHNGAFILFLTDSRHSQLYFGTRIKNPLAWVDKLCHLVDKMKSNLASYIIQYVHVTLTTTLKILPSVSYFGFFLHPLRLHLYGEATTY